MSLSDKERETLVELHTEKAELFLQQADEMCTLKHWDLAINRYYYACFDLVNGNFNGACPGILEANNEPPYNNIVSGLGKVQPAYTVFDRKKKEVYIYETMGCCSYYKTWAKYFEGDNFGNEAKIKVVKQEEHEWWADGKEHIATYKLVNDSLKLVENRIVE